MKIAPNYISVLAVEVLSCRVYHCPLPSKCGAQSTHGSNSPTKPHHGSTVPYSVTLYTPALLTNEMASHTVLPLLLLLPFLFAAAADVAPGPTPPGELNLTSILEDGGQYSTLLRLMQTTKISEQLENQLKNSYDGITFLAPNDNAFTKLKTGTLNGLTDQQQIQLLLYHVLPRYYSVTTFQTASNPLPTEASGPGGMYSVNVTTSTTSHLVNMSTGVVDVPISSTLVAKFPLAVYSIDDVLLPVQLFGSSSHKASAAQAPAGQAQAGKETARKKGVPKSDVAAEPAAEGEKAAEDSAKAAAGRGSVGWTPVAAFAVMAVVNLLVGV